MLNHWVGLFWILAENYSTLVTQVESSETECRLVRVQFKIRVVKTLSATCDFCMKHKNVQMSKHNMVMRVSEIDLHCDELLFEA